MPAIEPQPVELTAQLMDEAKADAPRLADAMFGKHAFLDSRNVSRQEYLRFIRYAWENGLKLRDGSYLPPDKWALQRMDAVGDQRFWNDIHDAYGLNARQGLKIVQDAVKAPAPMPPVPTVDRDIIEHPQVPGRSAPPASGQPEGLTAPVGTPYAGFDTQRATTLGPDTESA